MYSMASSCPLKLHSYTATVHVLDCLTFYKSSDMQNKNTRVQKGEANKKQQLSDYIATKLYMQLKTLISS